MIRAKALSERAVLPLRASTSAAGLDLFSATEGIVPARGRQLFSTDLALAIPHGFYGRIAPRSSLAWRYGIETGAGVIDSDYRGNVGVILFNHSDVDYEVKQGDRIAQLIVEQISTAPVIMVAELDTTIRQDGAYGSTGV